MRREGEEMDILNDPLDLKVVGSSVWYNSDTLVKIGETTDEIGLYEYMHLWIMEGIRTRHELTTSTNSEVAIQVETEASKLPPGDNSLSNSMKRLTRQNEILSNDKEYQTAMTELQILRLEAEKLMILIRSERRKFISASLNFKSEV